MPETAVRRQPLTANRNSAFISVRPPPDGLICKAASIRMSVILPLHYRVTFDQFVTGVAHLLRISTPKHLESIQPAIFAQFIRFAATPCDPAKACSALKNSLLV